MTRIKRLIIGYIIGGHVLGIVGAYLIAQGIKLIPLSITAGVDASSISTRVFTGLMLILGAICLFINATGMSIKPKVNWVKELIKDWPKKEDIKD